MRGILSLEGSAACSVRGMKKTQKVLLFMPKRNRGEREGTLWIRGGAPTMSLGPVIDDAVYAITKDDFFFHSHTRNVSERGLACFFLLSRSLYSGVGTTMVMYNVALTISETLLYFFYRCPLPLYKCIYVLCLSNTSQLKISFVIGWFFNILQVLY